MKFAFSTQSYKGDFRECKLLCESLDRFAPGIEHFIFVNDEDYLLFRSLNYSQHKVHKKSECTPWYFFRFPFKILDHFFWVSPFTFPMRGWIYQQICKLAIFDVIGDSYDFIINMDSEVIMIKPFDLNSVYKGVNLNYIETLLQEPTPIEENISDPFKNSLKEVFLRKKCTNTGIWILQPFL